MNIGLSTLFNKIGTQKFYFTFSIKIQLRCFISKEDSCVSGMEIQDSSSFRSLSGFSADALSAG